MSDDTKPALMSAARLAEIRETFAAYDNGEAECDAQSLADFTRDLLAHLDALTAPVPDDGGEAMVLAVFAEQQEFGAEEAAESWAALSPASRAENVRIALALDAHGYARGRAEGEAERARLAGLLDLARSFAGEREETIARLTAELAEARDAIKGAVSMYEDNDAARSAEAYAHEQALTAARREGAREEREACARIAEAPHRATRGGGPDDRTRIAAEIRARNDAAPVEGEDGAT